MEYDTQMGYVASGIQRQNRDVFRVGGGRLFHGETCDSYRGCDPLWKKAET